MTATTRTPDTDPAGRIMWAPPTATVNLDGEDALIDLNLQPVGQSLLRDLLRVAAQSDIVRHGLIDGLTRKANPLLDDAFRGAADRWLYLADISGALTITLDPTQANELAEDLDAAAVDRGHCPRCRVLIDSTGDELCGPCEEARR